MIDNIFLKQLTEYKTIEQAYLYENRLCIFVTIISISRGKDIWSIFNYFWAFLYLSKRLVLRICSCITPVYFQKYYSFLLTSWRLFLPTSNIKMLHICNYSVICNRIYHRFDSYHRILRNNNSCRDNCNRISSSDHNICLKPLLDAAPLEHITSTLTDLKGRVELVNFETAF